METAQQRPKTGRRPRRWQVGANTALLSVTGFRLVRGEAPPATRTVPYRRGRSRPPLYPEVERLVPSPVFLLSSVRSGSTLLRVILDSHSAIHSPHETHFRRLQVVPTTPASLKALETDDQRVVDLEHLLWDRMLDRGLRLSGKRIVVEKTPSNVFVADRLATAWPEARFIFLIRHPLSIARSWHAADPVRRPMRRAVPHVLSYLEHLERARNSHRGPTIRYEDLTADPEAETRRLCDFLGVDWEPGMLQYGRYDHGPLVAGIGDWSDTIRSGTVQPALQLPVPDQVPEALRPIARAWGYLG